MKTFAVSIIKNRLSALLLAVSLVAGLASCGGDEDDTIAPAKKAKKSQTGAPAPASPARKAVLY